MSLRLFLPLRGKTPPTPHPPPPPWIHPSSASPTELESVPSLRPRTPSFLRGPPLLRLSPFLMRTPTHVHVRACRPHTQPRKPAKSLFHLRRRRQMKSKLEIERLTRLLRVEHRGVGDVGGEWGGAGVEGRKKRTYF